MCDPVTLTAIAIGASVGAATAAATGGDPLQGALIGGAVAGFFPGGVGVTGTAFGPQLAGTFVTGFGSSVALGGVATAVGVGLLGGMLTPKAPKFPEQQSLQVQQFNSQNIATTGSGGRQAAGSLAEAIKRTKDRKLTQRDVGDLSIDTGSFAPTGLQFA